MKNVDLGFYILDESGNPKKITDYLEWGKWFQSNANRVVAETIIGDARISTVFLAMDWNPFSAEVSIPILYETMIFGGKYDERQWRWSTKAEAQRGHKKIVQKLTKSNLLTN